MSILQTIVGVNWHAMRLYRLARRVDARGHHDLAIFLLGVGRVISGIEIISGAEIGEGTMILHGSGTVIGAGSKIGRDCIIHHQVTLGARGGAPLFPIVGDGVTIYPGAKVLGKITIGDNAIIGANAVVLEDVPPGATVVGVPARVISHG